MSPVQAMEAAILKELAYSEHVPFPISKLARDCALAALRALRENLSEEMVDEAEKVCGLFCKDGGSAGMMLDAALLAAEQSGSLTDGERG